MGPLLLISCLALPVVNGEHFLRRKKNPVTEAPIPDTEQPVLPSSKKDVTSDIAESLWDCLMEGNDKESCDKNSNGACIFCAEPVYGICVTPSVAEKLNRYPMFNCDEAIGSGRHKS